MPSEGGLRGPEVIVRTEDPKGRDLDAATWLRQRVLGVAADIDGQEQTSAEPPTSVPDGTLFSILPEHEADVA
jgi:hypothetical protein